MSKAIFVTSIKILMLEERRAWRDAGIAQRMFREVDPFVTLIIASNLKELVRRFKEAQHNESGYQWFNGVIILTCLLETSWEDLRNNLIGIDPRVTVGVMVDNFTRTGQISDRVPVLRQPFRSEEIKSFLNLCPCLKE